MQTHLAVEKALQSKDYEYRNLLKRVRDLTVKYRTSPKAKYFLGTLYPLRIPGYVKIRW